MSIDATTQTAPAGDVAVRPLVVDDQVNQTFRVHRSAMTSPDVHRAEIERIFAKSWLYVGHESEISNPGDFVRRPLAGRPIFMVRGVDSGNINVFHNSCTHRGALVCRQDTGSAKVFSCFYHAWSFDTEGRLKGVPDRDAYAGGLKFDELGLKRVPRVESYRGFVFASFDPEIVDLPTYLAGAKDYIDLVIDQSPSGRMEIIAGVQEYDVAANWKLMVENSVDDYHLPSTHSTWLNFMANSGVKIEPPKEEGLVLPTRGKAVELGNGHFTTDNVNFRGRPVAKWIPLYGEAAKAEIDDIRKELVARLGPQRAQRVADTNRNLVIFPNLVINDGSSVTVRTFYPEGAGKMHVTAWALGPVEEGESARARRLDAFLTFYGPGGFATPDDVEALELVQQGLANWADDRWSEMSRGMGKEGDDQLNSDEHHLRIFWRRWNELMGAQA